MKNNNISRRDFLKLLALASSSAFLPNFKGLGKNTFQGNAGQNILVVVFDTFSAKHLSFLGYPRETTPNLSRIIDRATVYHNHYSGGSWTAPGTATILTGTYPWTHRAFNQQASIELAKERNNIFNIFPDYFRVGYSHNSIVDSFLHQLSADLDLVLPQKDLFLDKPLSLDRLFINDADISSLTWDRIIKKGEKGYTYSTILSYFYDEYTRRFSQKTLDVLKLDFPRGLPQTGEDDYFLLEDGIDRLISEVEYIPNPFLGYFHYLPPHRPYNTRREFVNAFLDDGLGYYIDKPKQTLFEKNDLDKPVNLKYQEKQRQLYDEFILYSDAEFGRLYASMQKMGLLENTWIILTSDHGEMFERGIFGHRTPFLYQPVIQIPLIILEPGQKIRQDIYTPTSSVDLLPTLLSITGNDIPAWTEGKVLPPYYNTAVDPDRSVFSVEATNSGKHDPLGPASVAMIKGKYKLTYYFEYEELKGIGPYFELYDLENDPEELNNLFVSDATVAQELRAELENKIALVDRPYTH